jgi:uncharacterized membrane protein YkvA (DUF1232 family)
MKKSKRQLKRKMKSYLWLIPNFLKLIGKLLRDPRVSKADKAILAATLIYTISPIDLIADFIPFFGLVDDAFLIALALTRLLYRAGEEPLREHWEGEGDIVSLIDTMRHVSKVFLPRRIHEHLLGKVHETRIED